MAEVDKDVHREEDLLSVRISNEVNLVKNNSSCPAVGEQILATPSLECEKAVVFQTSTEGLKEDEQLRRSCLLDIIDDSGRGCGKKKEAFDECSFEGRFIESTSDKHVAGFLSDGDAGMKRVDGDNDTLPLDIPNTVQVDCLNLSLNSSACSGLAESLVSISSMESQVDTNHDTICVVAQPSVGIVSRDPS